MNYLYIIPSFLLFILLSFPLDATQWTVSNNVERPAQFTNIQDAIDEAESGDTILVYGSSTNYWETITLNKPLVIIGEGMESSEWSGRTRVLGTVNIGRQNATTSASGSRFIGIYFSSTMNISGSFSGSNPGETWLEDIEFDRCWFGGSLDMSTSSTEYRDILMKNSLFDNITLWFAGSANYEGIVIENSVFSRGQIRSSGVKDFEGELVIRNCHFLNRTTDVFDNLEGIVVENCIFYLAEPTGAVGSTFNNNLTYICNDNTLPPNVPSGQPENEGENNIINENPRFTDFPSLGGSFSWSHDFTLLSNSPAIGAGVGGTNIGLSGGNYPVDVNLPRNSFTPVVISIDLPNSSVPENGVLQGQIEATIRN